MWATLCCVFAVAAFPPRPSLPCPHFTKCVQVNNCVGWNFVLARICDTTSCIHWVGGHLWGTNMNSVQEMQSFEYNIGKNKNSTDKVMTVVRCAAWEFWLCEMHDTHCWFHYTVWLCIYIYIFFDLQEKTHQTHTKDISCVIHLCVLFSRRYSEQWVHRVSLQWQVKCRSTDLCIGVCNGVHVKCQSNVSWMQE